MNNAANPVGRAHRTRGPATRARVTVTIPAETLEAATARVQKGAAPSLSAYVSAALADKVASDAERDSYIAWLRKLDEELGPPSAEAYEWAREALGL